MAGISARHHTARDEAGSDDEPSPRGKRSLRARPLALAFPGWCSGSQQRLAIGAVVLPAGNCQFTNAGTAALAFGQIDPSSSGNAVARVDIPFRCNGGASPTVAWSVSSDDGLHKAGANAPRLRHATNAAHHMRYSLDVPAPAVAPKNTDLTMTVTGTLAASEFQNAPGGDYRDAIVLTIAP